MISTRFDANPRRGGRLLGLGLALTLVASTASAELLSDEEMDEVVAGNTLLLLDLSFDLPTEFDGQLEAEGLGSIDELLNQALKNVLPPPSSGDATRPEHDTGVDVKPTEDGVQIRVDFPQVDLTEINNTLQVGGDALANAQSLVTALALGDIGITANLVVVINPEGGHFDIDTDGLNFGQLGLPATK
ncbi:MAG: hypothetical protein AAF533_24655 [Acidobacteriota bacterium]